ncbi:MAG: sulfotransferase [Acidobacteria bacterium]|nr:sulfotransferase [Acidobacteriota bacterium]
MIFKSSGRLAAAAATGREMLSRLKRVIRGKVYPFHQKEGFRPFFIVGPPRSGNTLLRRLLQAGPDVHIPPETYVLGDVIHQFERNAVLSWPQIVRMSLSTFEYHPAFESFGLSLRPLAQRLNDLPEEKRSLAAVIDGLYRFHGESVGKSFVRWGDKTTENYKCLEELLRVFPDALFIIIYRDGADSIVSLVKAGLQPDLQTAAARWLESAVRIPKFTSRHTDICLEIRYEDLVRDAEKTVREVYGFLGLDFSPQLLQFLDVPSQMPDIQSSRYAHLQNVLNPVNEKSIGKGRESLTRDEKRFLQEKIGPELALLKYPPLV